MPRRNVAGNPVLAARAERLLEPYGEDVLRAVVAERVLPALLGNSS